MLKSKIGESPHIPSMTAPAAINGLAPNDVVKAPSIPPGMVAITRVTITIMHSPMDSPSRENGHSATLGARLAAMTRTGNPHRQMRPPIGSKNTAKITTLATKAVFSLASITDPNAAMEKNQALDTKPRMTIAITTNGSLKNPRMSPIQRFVSKTKLMSSSSSRSRSASTLARSSISRVLTS